MREALRTLLADADLDTAVVDATPGARSSSASRCRHIPMLTLPPAAGRCACCVGVLSGAFKAQVLADVQRLALERRDDADTFALNIKLPSVVLLREYALLAHLRAEVAGFGGRSPADLKDVLKVSYSRPCVYPSIALCCW